MVTVPDCVRVTVPLLDIFGLASSQRTRLNVHAHAHRGTAETPALTQHLFPGWLGAESPEDLPPLSTSFLGSALNFSWHAARLLHTYCRCVLETCGIPRPSSRRQSNPWRLDKQLPAELEVGCVHYPTWNCNLKWCQTGFWFWIRQQLVTEDFIIICTFSCSWTHVCGVVDIYWNSQEWTYNHFLSIISSSCVVQLCWKWKMFVN